MEPLIFNCFKPARMSSYDIIREFKRNIPKKELGKIGHFGTLDPFACGVLLIGVSGAQKLNNLIHDDLTKTYLAIGKLGVDYDTGDMTGVCTQTDDSDYFNKEISQFSKDFIQSQLEEKFLGTYWQAPHKFSAAKYEGKKLYEYAREGVEIKKEKKERFVHKIEVVKYAFPYLSIRFEVSSGTYIRTLFSDCAQYLGTLGTLVSLVRESIGDMNIHNSIPYKGLPGKESFSKDLGMTPDEAYPAQKYTLNDKLAAHFVNGVQLSLTQFDYKFDATKKYWLYNEKNELLGLANIENEKIKSQFIFSFNS